MRVTAVGLLHIGLAALGTLSVVNPGLAITWPTVDLDGVSRPQAGRWGIGACEFVFPHELFVPLVLKQYS